MPRIFNRRRLRKGSNIIASAILTLFGLLVLTFIIGHMMPVDPVARIVGQDADRATYMATYHRLGLDQPLWMQFALYVDHILHGDFGVALLTGHPVVQDLQRVFPATIELGTISIIFGAGVGIPLGVLAAVKRGRLTDHVIRVVTLLGHSIPIFWLGMMGLVVFYARLGWLGGAGRIDIFYEGLVEPRTGFMLIDSLLAGDYDVFWNAVNHIVLPASILGYSSMAYLTRMTRSFMLEQLGQEYVITARVKGLTNADVIWRHAFRNIAVQLTTIVALTYGNVLEGAVLTETVFSWPGFGQYLTNNLLLGDMNAIMACVLIVGTIFIALNLLSDILYGVFDPRTR
jgi:peptide/nickel transport system permease protein